ncbi:MAG: hypothetical protein M1814_001023 [Vezdaea aestivalis]|nr:MAG: hypothetical protein M1814_001023 [Vezdaea aestivalis]
MDITGFLASKRDNATLLGDYGAYRAQLSRRLATLRKKLGKTATKGKKYAAPLPLKAEEVGNNHELVHLQLLVSERAWAHAMHMRSVRSADTSRAKIQGSDRKHIISRFHKAASNATALLSILEAKDASKATDNNLLEARAYAESLAGAADFDKTAWADSLRHYSASHVIYAALESSTKKDVFRDFRVSHIDPSLRYGAHMSQMPRIVTIPTIARKWFPAEDAALVKAVEQLDPYALKDEEKTESGDSLGETADLPKEISWRSRTVPIEDVAVATALASVTKASQQLSSLLSSPHGKELSRKEKAAAYDSVLIPSQDAADAVKQAIVRLAADGVQQGDKKMQVLQITRTAVNFALIGWRVGRNRVWDGELSDDTETKRQKASKNDKPKDQKKPSTGRKLAKIRERVVLYDATLQSLDSMKELPGVAADSKFVSELEGTYLYFQSFKCLLLARSHSILSALPNALALYARAESLCSKSVAAPLLQAQIGLNDEAPTLNVNKHSREQLHKLLATEVIRHRALVELEAERTKAAKTGATPSRPLIENLNEYPASGVVDLDNIVTFPPKLEPVPLKPIFLDLAWNYIEYPGQKKAAPKDGGKGASAAGERNEQAPSKKGWFGFGR